MGLKALFSYTLVSTFIATSIAINCYNPNGSDRNLDSDVAEGTVLYTPCSQVTKFSMCCRQPNEGGDVCRPDGLCQGFASDGSLPIWRESCTDRSWQSPYCLNLCTTGINEDGNNNQAGDTIVIQCKDDSWCCGPTNSTCCERGDGKWIVNGRITDTNPNLQTSTTSSSSSSTSSSTSSSSTSTTTPANQQSLPSPDPQPSKSNNTGAIAGGVVGGVAVLALLAAAIWFFRRRGRKNREQHQHPPEQEYQDPPSAPETTSPPNTIPIPGLHEAYAPTREKDPAHLDSRERFEIGYQDKDNNNRQELAA